VTLEDMRAMGLRLAGLCEQYGIVELSVFGSVVRGDARPDSDVDLLYVRVPGNDLGMSYFACRKTWKSSSASLSTLSRKMASAGPSGRVPQPEHWPGIHQAGPGSQLLVEHQHSGR